MSKIKKQMNNSQNNRMNPDIIVIGAGIVGSMITKFLRSKGKQVLLIDGKEPYSGSKCSSGIWHDSWIREDIREFYNDGLEVLQEFAGIEPLQYEDLDNNGAIGQLNYVNWKSICDMEFLEWNVVSICKRIVTCRNPINGQFNEYRTTQFIAREKVFLCAGAYTDKILIDSGYLPIGLYHYFGSAIETVERKQMSKVRRLFNEFWAIRVKRTILKFSDSTMIKNPPLDTLDERCETAHERLKISIKEVMGKHFKFSREFTRELYGLRPYLPTRTSHNYVNRHDIDLYSFTGTGKDTTILCGYLALKAAEIVLSSKLTTTEHNWRK